MTPDQLAMIERLRLAMLPGYPPAADLAARERLMPRTLDGRSTRPIGPPPGVEPRIGAVLALVYPRAETLVLPLTVRRDDLADHRGEVSLPGGRQDPGETLDQTALRECWEELGIEPQGVSLLGSMLPVYIGPSNFQVTPFVGWLAAPPTLRPQASEVAAVLELPLAQLLHPDGVVVETWQRPSGRIHVPFYPFQGHAIWGATAIVLSQLAVRLAGPAQPPPSPSRRPGGG